MDGDYRFEFSEKRNRKGYSDGFHINKDSSSLLLLQIRLGYYSNGDNLCGNLLEVDGEKFLSADKQSTMMYTGATNRRAIIGHRIDEEIR